MVCYLMQILYVSSGMSPKSYLRQAKTPEERSKQEKMNEKKVQSQDRYYRRNHWYYRPYAAARYQLSTKARNSHRYYCQP